jgi:hypothetical protein
MADSTENKIVVKENSDKVPVQASKGSDRQGKILYILIVTFLVFTLEIFVRDPFTRFSDSIQERLNFEYKCELASHFVWFKYQGKSIIFLFLFNVSNIFVSLTMITLDSLAIFINGTLKLFYTEARPYWRNPNLSPCGCALNYGNPSTTGLDVYLYSLVVFKGLYDRYSNKIWKFSCWCLFLVPIILAWVSRFFQNVHSLHQLTFGTLVGYIVQYIYFEILEIDMNSVEQLKKLVNILVNAVYWNYQFVLDFL